MREIQGWLNEMKASAGLCSCGATCGAGPLWGCRFCGGCCCPHCTYAPEGLAVCFRCARDIFGVYVPWVSAEVPERVVPRRHVHTTYEAQATR